VNDYAKHSAGAIITHRGKFEKLRAYSNKIEISQKFRTEWVIPYYMQLERHDEDWINQMIDLKSKITDEIVLQNLGDFNWRTRSVGSFFTSIKNKVEFVDIIGVHLLKSEVCFAGNQYAISLSYFNTEKSIYYLNEYLDYYLLHPELYFNQSACMSAIKYLDRVNGTNDISRHLENWKSMLNEQKKLEIKNRQTLLDSPSVPTEVKDHLSKSKIDGSLSFEIHTNNIEKSIETIKTIANR
jgi:hypothetical protein